MTRSEIRGAKHEIYWHIFFSCLLVVPYFFVVLPFLFYDVYYSNYFTFRQAASGLLVIYILARVIEINGPSGYWDYSLADLKHDFLLGVIYIGLTSYIAFISQDEIKSIRILTLTHNNWIQFALFWIPIIIIMLYFENKIHPPP